MGALSILNPTQAARLKAALWYGEPGPYLADNYGCSLTLVRHIARGDRYTETEWPDGTTGPLTMKRIRLISRARSKARREVLPQITRTMNARVRAILEADHD